MGQEEQIGHPENRKGAYKEHLKAIFLEEYPHYCTIYATCKAVGIGRTTFHSWRQNDPEFERGFIEADTRITENLERSAIERARDKKDKASHLLLMFLLKARDPQKYKERFQHEIDPKFIQGIVSHLLGAVRKSMPEFCPGCNTHLGLSNRLAKELHALSKDLAGTLK